MIYLNHMIAHIIVQSIIIIFRREKKNKLYFLDEIDKSKKKIVTVCFNLVLNNIVLYKLSATTITTNDPRFEICA